MHSVSLVLILLQVEDLQIDAHLASDSPNCQDFVPGTLTVSEKICVVRYGLVQNCIVE